MDNKNSDEYKKQLFHSNSYASIVDGNRIGSTSHISFNKRQKIENNRNVVMGYNRSAIGVGYNYRSVSRSSSSVRDRNSESPRIHRSVNAPIQSKPTTRKYDPFHS